MSEEEDIDILAGRLYSNDSTLTEICVNEKHIGDEGVTVLSHALHYSEAVVDLYLGGNHIGDKGAKAIAECLARNCTITRLDLADNIIGDEGAISLSDSLKFNETLKVLILDDNDISDQGSISFAKCILINETLMELWFMENNMNYKGAMALLESVYHNATLTHVRIDVYIQDIQPEIDFITGWNEVGTISPENIKQTKIPARCRRRLVFILLILNEWILCHKLKWLIMNMLKIYDIVKDGNPRNNLTWV